jgi:hypothetical protein
MKKVLVAGVAVILLLGAWRVTQVEMFAEAAEQRSAEDDEDGLFVPNTTDNNGWTPQTLNDKPTEQYLHVMTGTDRDGRSHAAAKGAMPPSHARTHRGQTQTPTAAAVKNAAADKAGDGSPWARGLALLKDRWYLLVVALVVLTLSWIAVRVWRRRRKRVAPLVLFDLGEQPRRAGRYDPPPHSETTKPRRAA